MKKKIVILMLAATISLSGLAGCKEKNSDTQDNKKEEEQEQEEEPQSVVLESESTIYVDIPEDEWED